MLVNRGVARRVRGAIPIRKLVFKRYMQIHDPRLLGACLLYLYAFIRKRKLTGETVMFILHLKRIGLVIGAVRRTEPGKTFEKSYISAISRIVKQ